MGYLGFQSKKKILNIKKLIYFLELWQIKKSFENKYNKFIAFLPTGFFCSIFTQKKNFFFYLGWAFGQHIDKVTKKSSGNMTIYGVPYR
jgi:hypothetical protein